MFKKEFDKKLIKRYSEVFDYFFRDGERIDHKLQVGLFKWGNQLGISTKELNDRLYSDITKKEPVQLSKAEALEAVYDLLIFIYLDDIVEDFEYEILDLYAKSIGLEGSIVNDILKAIATAKDDEVSLESVKKDLKLILEV